MKKPKNTAVSKRRAARKGVKKVARKKVAKKHLEAKAKKREELRIKEERIWQEYYDSLVGSQI